MIGRVTMDQIIVDVSKVKTVKHEAPVVILGKQKNKTITADELAAHANTINYENLQEARLLQNILTQLTPKAAKIGQFTVDRPNPQTITISSREANGIYFKENFHPGWKARVNGKKNPVYKAGLGFMYIPISSENSKEKNRISLKFEGSLATWGLTTLSLLTLLIVTLYSLTTKPFKMLRKIIKRKITNPIKNWWGKE